MAALKKEREELEHAAEQLLSLALNAGAEKAEVCGTYGHKARVALEKQDYHMASIDDGFNFGLRVLTGGRQGFVSCNTTDPRELKEMALRAVEIAGFSPVNPYSDIGATENLASEVPVDLWDPSLHQLSLQTQKDWTKLMVETARKDARFRINEGEVEIASSLFLVMNSLGTLKLERETVAAWSLMGMGVDGDNITSFDYFQEIARRGAPVPQRLLDSTQRFVTRVLENLSQGNAETYKGMVVFSPRAVRGVLIGNLVYHLNGRNVLEGTTRWKREDVGRRILHPTLTLEDTPWEVDRRGCALFDREGCPTRRTELIRSGELRTILRDRYAAKALDAPPTGHASGGPTSVPSVSPHTLRMAGGDRGRDEWLREVTGTQKRFLVVHRFSGQVDPVTGDFSGVAKGGEWWADGQRQHFVQETLISGNLFHCLGEGLVGLSRETEVVDSADELPWLVADGVSVTSGRSGT